MRELSHKVNVMTSHLVDVVGTGSGAHTFIAPAPCSWPRPPVRVAHGGRSVSSKSGSADVMEALGVPTGDANRSHHRIADSGVGFMFAPSA